MLTKTLLAGTLLALLILTIPTLTASAQTQKVPVIILFKDKPTEKHMQLIQSSGGEIKRTYHIINGFAANLPPGAIDNLKHNPLVISVDPDFEVKALDLGADTQIRANQVWTSATGQGVSVAILDTGTDTTHPEFSGRIALCHSEITNTNTCEDQNGHGTHTAGIAGAAGVNTNAKGVAPAVSLYIDQVLDSTGSGSISGVIAGIDYVTAHGAKVISMSLGTNPISRSQPNCDTAIPSLTTAINNAVSAGVTVVAAAGNSGKQGVGAPGCISSTIAVGAVDSTDTIASFSSVGGPMADHGIVAPGVNIFSSYVGGGYATLSGTSMATPHVSGTIGLMLQSNPTLTPAQVKNTLFSTACTSTTSPSCPTGTVPNTVYGYGRIDALRAFNAVAPPAPDFAISSSPTSLTIPAGTSAGSTITVSSLNGFSGTVSLATFTSDPSVTATLSLPSVVLTSGGSSSSALSISATTGGTYTATVTGTSGSLTHSTTLTVTVITVPTAPQNLVATAGNSQVILSWTASSSNGGSAITGYKIYRSTTAGAETFLTPVGNVVTYTDSGLTNGVTYYYKVTAVNSVGESVLSNEANAAPSASVPTLHVSSITTATQILGGGNKKIDTFVTVKDSNNMPVSGAAVSIKVTLPSGNVLASSGITDASGNVKIVVGPTKQIGSYTSCIDNVVLTGFAFDGIKPCVSGTL